MEDSLIIYKIASGLIIPSIIGIVKLYADFKVLRNSHENLNNELQEYKRHQKEDLDTLGNHIDRRFEKLEHLLEKLWQFERDHKS